MNTRIDNALKDIKKLKETSIKLEEKFNLALSKIAEENGVARKADSFDDYDPDSSPIAWCYYEQKYAQFLEFPKDFKKGFYKKRFENSLGFKKSQGRIIAFFENEIEFAGDSSFNFNHKKLGNYFSKVVADKTENRSDIKEEMIDLLLLCNSMHHSVFNFNLMPVTGGLNNFKGRGYDRLDFFLCQMNNFFSSNSQKMSDHAILKARGGNKESLLGYLRDNIVSYEEYCNIFYSIDSKKDKCLYEKLLENGNNPIIDCESLLSYIEVAIAFWKHQADHYDTCVERKQNLSTKGDE